MQPALDLIVNHYRGAAMSHGALTGASHQTIATALNKLGGFSNSGEGGETRFRNDAPERPWGPFWEKTLADRAPTPRFTLSMATCERAGSVRGFGKSRRVVSASMPST